MAEHSNRGKKTRKSRDSLHGSTAVVWAEELSTEGNTILLQISYTFGGKTWEKLISFSSVRATLNSSTVWAVKQSFCLNHFSLITCLPKIHCSFHSLSDVVNANSVSYQSIYWIFFVTSQFDSILLNYKCCGVKGKVVISICIFCRNLSYLMPSILKDMKVIFFHLPPSKQRSQLGKVVSHCHNLSSRD